jgi:hypothetical protein
MILQNEVHIFISCFSFFFLIKGALWHHAEFSVLDGSSYAFWFLVIRIIELRVSSAYFFGGRNSVFGKPRGDSLDIN